MENVLWFAVLVAGIASLQVGSHWAGRFIEAVRARFGLLGATAGVLVGLFTALPEISVSSAAALFGWSELGLGAALGSNVPAIPFAIVVAYAALATGRTRPETPPTGTAVKPQAVNVQIVPYLATILVLALITLPPPFAGLQPIDAVILIGTLGVVLWHAWTRRPSAVDPTQTLHGTWRAALGVVIVAAGAVGAVMAARRLTDAAGVPDLVGGLFAVGFLCALPETLAAWMLARRGQITMAIAAAATDGIVSLTLAMVPAALVGTPVGNMTVYAVNLGYLTIVLALYLAMGRGSGAFSIDRARAEAFGGSYLIYLAVMGWVLWPAASA